MVNKITIRIVKISDREYDVAKSGKHNSYATYREARAAAVELLAKAGGPTKARILDLTGEDHDDA